MKEISFDKLDSGVSIVIPVYNAEQYLKKCLESIINQTFTEYEVVIVNDGSTDGSQKIIDTYVEKYPDKFRSFSQDNAGQSVARNLALKYIKKEYVTFLDSDDYLDKRYLEILFKTAKTKACDMVCSGQQKVDLQGRCICQIKYIPNKSGKYIMRRLNFAGKLYKTSFLKKHFSGFAEGKTYEDNPFNLRMFFLAKRLEILKYVGYYQLVREGSTTATKIKRERLPFKEIRNTLEYLCEHKKEVNDWQLLEFTVLSFFTYFTFEANKNHHYMKMSADLRRSDMKVIMEVCTFTRKMVLHYFPKYAHNKYIGIFKCRELELKQRAGTWLYVVLCRFNMVNQFAQLYYRI